MSTQQYVFQVTDKTRVQDIPGLTAKTADELCTGLLAKINTGADVGTVSVATASDKPAGFVEDRRTLLYRPTDIYAAAGEYVNIMAGHVLARVSAEYFIGDTLPSAGADLYSAAGGKMDTSGTNAIGKVLTTGDAVRWPPNTTKSVVLVACHFGGKDI